MAPQRLPKSTAVYFFCQKLGIGGRGSVRYCEQRGQGYAIGLEFPSGTGWKGLRDANLLALAAKVNDEKVNGAEIVASPEAIGV